MEIFIGNLAADGTLIELHDLLGDQQISTRFERRLGRDCFDRNYHYFIVHTESNQEGCALIKRLNGKLFNGRPIIARGYLQRSGSDRWSGEDRRINPAADE